MSDSIRILGAANRPQNEIVRWPEVPFAYHLHGITAKLVQQGVAGNRTPYIQIASGSLIVLRQSLQTPITLINSTFQVTFANGFSNITSSDGLTATAPLPRLIIAPSWTITLAIVAAVALADTIEEPLLLYTPVRAP